MNDPRPTKYNDTVYPSRRKALRAKREAGDREGQPTLRRRGDK